MAEKNIFQGKFIVLDGPDGCGKSTQSKLLSEWINSQGTETVSFRDPGTTIIGEKIRDILLDTSHEKMTTRTELLLYMAARAQLWQECIAPALSAEKCVILDRWLSSTCAYQGYAGGFGMQNVIKIAADSLERPWPDLTIILALDIKTAAGRLNSELDRMELKGDTYHQKVIEGFIELARNREDVVTVDSSQQINKVHDDVKKIIMSKL